MSDPRNTVCGMTAARQHAFEFRTWGGRRAGAGRKTTRPRPALPHRTREDFRPYQTVHVTLRTADHAVRYVLGNYASPATRRGERVSSEWVDPYASAATREPRHAQCAFWPEPVTREAETWLLRSTGGRNR